MSSVNKYKEIIMKIHNFLFIRIISAIFFSFLTFQAQAITLTFDDGVNGTSAETFYQDFGVTFSGGGLLSDGSSGGLAGQPVFSGDLIGTLGKQTGAVYSDSFFDIWIHFEHDVFDVSGDYFGNALYGGTVTAYDSFGIELGMNNFAAQGAIGSTTLGTFNFSTLDAISTIHMISDGAVAATYLDNLTFEAAAVTEPSTVLLLGAGLIGIIGLSRKKKSLFK